MSRRTTAPRAVTTTFLFEWSATRGGPGLPAFLAERRSNDLKTEDDLHPSTDSRTREAERHRYSAEAVEREIAKDRRSKRNEARLLALLRGRG
jgi:hypothetical protein